MFERKVSKAEYNGLVNSTIPVFDEYGEYNELGLAIVVKDGKRGVVNDEPKVVVSAEFEKVTILKNGVIVTYDAGLYSLVDRDGLEITKRVFVSEEEAISYGNFF